MSVRNALLGLLSQKARHGYELRAAFEALIGGEQNWDVRPAQVYTTLARLAESGFVEQTLVEQDGGPEKRIYALTPAGQAELVNWLMTGIESEHQRDEFYVKLMISLVISPEFPQANPYRVIHTQRAHLYQELHDTTAQRGRSDPKTDLAQILFMDKVIMHLEADLRWMDMIEARLDEVKRQPLPEPEIKLRGRPRKPRPD
jgi:DNA-binding PadR family transcriptional regulator